MNNKKYNKLKKERDLVWVLEVIVTISLIYIGIRYLSLPLVNEHYITGDKRLLNQSIGLIAGLIPFISFMIPCVAFSLLNEKKGYISKRFILNKINTLIYKFHKRDIITKKHNIDIVWYPMQAEWKFYYKDFLVFFKNYESRYVQVMDYVNWESIYFIYKVFNETLADINEVEAEEYKSEAEEYKRHLQHFDKVIFEEEQDD